jgi:SAM-dependent methyltransferase
MRRLISPRSATLPKPLKSSGRDEVNILDAGCGPGTWLRRVVTRACELGASRITARGFDVAEVQVIAARRLAADLSGLPRVGITFDVADITRKLPEQDDTIDMTLCLYSVLNHLHGSVVPPSRRSLHASGADG